MSQAPAGLVEWVPGFVEAHELWTLIPPCWAEHPALVAELEVLSDWSATLTEADTPPMEWAGWFDYLGRVLTRLAGLPAAKCTVHAHKAPLTWDVEEFLRARRDGR